MLSYPAVRKLVSEGFKSLICSNFNEVDVIAGVATGAIAHGALIADAMNLPFVYVRSAPKGHGLENLIEGHLKPGSRVVVVEDLISTGLSSLKAVEALQQAGANVLGMVAIFTYGFDVAKQSFEKHGIPVYTLANYNQLIEHAVEVGLVTKSEQEVLKSWRDNPEKWGR